MANVITLKPVVIPAQQRPDGTYNLKIRLTFKRKSRILSTNITIPKSALNKKHEIKDSDLLIKAYAIVHEIQGYLNDLKMRDLDILDVDGILAHIKRGKEEFHLDFFEYAQRIIRTKSQGTQITYRTAVNAFRRFVKRDSFDVSEFNVTLLKDFEQFINNEPKQIGGSNAIHMKKKGVSSSRYIGKLHYIYQCARDEYNDEDAGVMNIPRDPFARVKLEYAPSIARISKDPEFIQKVISFSGKCTESQRRALDIYIISFALMGMNAADLLDAPPAKDGIITYNRVKTKNRRADNAEHKVRIEPCIRQLIDKYSDPSGKKMFCFSKYFKNSMALSSSLRSRLAAWAKKNGEEPFTLYSARHSWATIARSSRCGIGKDVVNECLCHIDPQMKIADVYIEKDWTVLWNANAKVLSLFDWSQIQNV